MGDYEPALRHEFEGGDGSFLLQLRCGPGWDRAAFARLVAAMERCAADHAGRESLPRWVAEGFWFAECFTADWSGHPDFPRPDAEYHGRALARLHELSFWLFTGEHPLQGGGPLGPL